MINFHEFSKKTPKSHFFRVFSEKMRFFDRTIVVRFWRFFTFPGGGSGNFANSAKKAKNRSFLSYFLNLFEPISIGSHPETDSPI